MSVALFALIKVAPPVPTCPILLPHLSFHAAEKPYTVVFHGRRLGIQLREVHKIPIVGGLQGYDPDGTQDGREDGEDDDDDEGMDGLPIEVWGWMYCLLLVLAFAVLSLSCAGFAVAVGVSFFSPGTASSSFFVVQDNVAWPIATCLCAWVRGCFCVCLSVCLSVCMYVCMYVCRSPSFLCVSVSSFSICLSLSCRCLVPGVGIRRGQCVRRALAGSSRHGGGGGRRDRHGRPADYLRGQRRGWRSGHGDVVDEGQPVGVRRDRQVHRAVLAALWGGGE